VIVKADATRFFSFFSPKRVIMELSGKELKASVDGSVISVSLAEGDDKSIVSSVCVSGAGNDKLVIK